MIRFTVPGRPRSKQRPRTALRRGKPVTYTPAMTRNAERDVAWYARQAGARPVQGPVAVRITLYLRDRRADIDWDNAAKLVCDALNGVAWVDDRQVVVGRVCKRYVGRDGNERTEVVVRELTA